MGLGNPGPEYANTRHNAGAMVVDVLADRHGGKLKKGRELALVDEVRVGQHRLALAFPQTYMNDSGRSVSMLVRRYGIADLARLVVVHDELDLPLGKLQVKAGGGLAGHNGLRSIRDHLHSVEFTRVRIGIGKPPGGKEQGASHVLKTPSKKDRTELEVSVAVAADVVEVILNEGVTVAQNRFNG